MGLLVGTCNCEALYRLLHLFDLVVETQLAIETKGGGVSVVGLFALVVIGVNIAEFAPGIGFSTAD